MDFQDQNGSEEIDVDSLLSNINEPSEGIPMSAKPDPEPAAPTPAPVQEFEYDWRGQKVKEPIDVILKRAGMGRDYNHLVEEHKSKVSEWEKQRQENDTKYSRYREVDEFVAKNPDWWQHVEQSWQSREKPAEIDPNLKPFLDELNQVKSKLSEFEQKEQQLIVSQEDEAFAKEEQGIREKYSDLPWDTPGPDGKSLYYKVLKHGTENGIKSFKTAFTDFYHDELEKRAESRGKEAVVKDTQKKTKLGLLGETQAPKKGITSAQNIKNRSYDDLTREALEELGIT